MGDVIAGIDGHWREGRLLLEYARVTSLDRKAMDYVG